MYNLIDHPSFGEVSNELGSVILHYFIVFRALTLPHECTTRLTTPLWGSVQCTRLCEIALFYLTLLDIVGTFPSFCLFAYIDIDYYCSFVVFFIHFLLLFSSFIFFFFFCIVFSLCHIAHSDCRLSAERWQGILSTLSILTTTKLDNTHVQCVCLFRQSNS